MHRGNLAIERYSREDSTPGISPMSYICCKASTASQWGMVIGLGLDLDLVLRLASTTGHLDFRCPRLGVFYYSGSDVIFDEPQLRQKKWNSSAKPDYAGEAVPCVLLSAVRLIQSS